MKLRCVLVVGSALLLSSPADAMSVTVLDPYLVRPDKLSDLQLESFLTSDPNLSNYQASALTEDGVAAGIVVVSTDSSAPVTIDVQNVGGLAPYTDDFLGHAPSSGAASLTVSNLWNINGTYYAVALFQAPATSPAGQGQAYSAGVTATQNGSQSAGASVNLILPPVILVHGLWGDATSLSDMESYLDGAGLWHPSYVTPICYSKYLAFDARKDPLTDGKHPCEITSHNALEAEVNAVLATLDGDRVVDGRVDIIAHSMGGLVLRNYASQKGYTSPRNRMQGQFHTVATLNASEAGSLLANFLIGHRNSQRKAPLYTPQGAVWDLACGFSDVTKCFDGLGYPLYGPGLSIKSGAVFALEPGSPNLTNPKLSGPDIPNIQWLAISSLAPKNSALAAGVNTLIAALYKDPDGRDVPTVDSILLDQPNDAIVDLASQTKGASQGHFVTLSGLSHTYLVGSLLTLLSGGTFDDDSVLQDPGTEAVAACWVATAGTGTCFSGDSPRRETAYTTAQNVRPIDGIRLTAPSSTVLGKPFQIAVRSLVRGAAPKLTLFQQSDAGHIETSPVKPARVEGDTSYVTVTPLFPGEVTLGIGAHFDGAAASRTVQLRVALPKSAPIQFKANVTPTLVLILSDDTKAAMLRPVATYHPPVGQVFLSPDVVQCRALNDSGVPAIYISPDNEIHGLRPGQAEIECRMGSSRDRLHVLVRAANQ
jgi:pimeloyl-ACP methyl ester carboxylesterase